MRQGSAAWRCRGPGCPRLSLVPPESSASPASVFPAARQTGRAPAPGDRRSRYFAVVLELVEKPRADSVLSEHWGGGGSSFVFLASTHSVWRPDVCNAVSILCSTETVWYFMTRKKKANLDVCS